MLYSDNVLIFKKQTQNGFFVINNVNVTKVKNLDKSPI